MWIVSWLRRGLGNMSIQYLVVSNLVLSEPPKVRAAFRFSTVSWAGCWSTPELSSVNNPVWDVQTGNWGAAVAERLVTLMGWALHHCICRWCGPDGIMSLSCSAVWIGSQMSAKWHLILCVSLRPWLSVGNQLRLFRHLVRIPPGRLPEAVFSVRPAGRRSRGRPRFGSEIVSLHWPGNT